MEIPESAFPLERILTVHARDLDTGEFGQVRYFINGEGSDTFAVDPVEVSQKC